MTFTTTITKTTLSAAIGVLMMSNNLSILISAATTTASGWEVKLSDSELLRSPLGQLRRTPSTRSSQNSPSTYLGEIGLPQHAHARMGAKSKARIETMNAPSSRSRDGSSRTWARLTGSASSPNETQKRRRRPPCKPCHGSNPMTERTTQEPNRGSLEAFFARYGEALSAGDLK